jgi:hypothetical protein
MNIATFAARRTGRSAALALAGAMLAALLPAGPVAIVFGAATVTAATGGTAIAASTAADAPVPAWTTLVGPQITEDAAAQLVTNGTVVLTAPSGFEFKSATGTIAGGGGGCDIALSALSFSATTVSVTVTTQSTVACTVTWNGLQVRPTTGSLGGAVQKTGNIANTGNTGPAGTNYGTLTEIPGAAAKLGYTQQPSSAPSGVAFLTQPKVAVQDAVGNTISGDGASTVTLTLVAPTAGGPGTLAGCTSAVTVSAGIATFSSCRVTGTGIGYKLTATDSTGAGGGHPYTAATSAYFDIPDNLGFETQPGGGAGAGSKAQGGVAFTGQPKVTVRVGTSNFTTNKAANDSTTTITLSIKSGTGTAGAVLTCDQAANTLKATVGSSQFSGCRIDKSGTGYKLVATSAPAYGTNAWESTAFDVVAGPATKLTFVTQPAGAAAGQAFTTQPVVAITDAGGNVVTTGVSANVSLTIGTNPGVPTGVLSCTPSITVATATSGANAGKAIFSGCKISNAGVGYTINAIPTGIVGVASLLSTTSSAFTVTAPVAQITVTPSAAVITWGQSVTITTTFLVNGAAKTFTLEGSRDGITWTTIATLITGAGGTSSYAYRPVSSLFYRAVFGGTSDLIAGTSNAARAVVRQIAILRPTNSGATKSIARNKTITFTTTVRPSRPELPKATVRYVFYRYTGGKWTYVTKREVVIDAYGRAILAWKFTSRGSWYVRSIALPTTYNANSVWGPRERYSVY